MQSRDLIKIPLKIFLLALCLILLLSCLSFDIGDEPSSYVYPNNDKPVNLCGRFGAFPAYYIHYYLGPGVYVILVTAMSMIILSLAGKPLTQKILRSIGMILLTTVVSAAAYLLWEPDSAVVFGNTFPMGRGGILGIAAGHYLLINCAKIGTLLVLLSSGAVGAILLADSVVAALLRWIGAGFVTVFGGISPAIESAREQTNNLGSIWKKLENKKRALQAEDQEYEYISEDDDEHIEQNFTDAGEPDSEAEEPSAAAAAAETRSGGPVKKIVKKLKIKKAVAVSKPQPFVQKTYDDYVLPPMDLLEEPECNFAEILEDMVKEKARQLEEILAQFNINARIVNAEPGPAITLYELELAAGIKVSQITSLANDMARALGAPSVRIVAPIPGKHTVGIEAPNTQREIVRIRDLIEIAGSKPEKMTIPLFLGKDSQGQALVSDLAAMPHALIAGTTGSGKSVCINTIITSILLTKRPDEVKLILVDPKMVEMVIYNNIPHLMCPIVTEMRRAEQILEWAVTKMDERYALLAEAGVRNITAYNQLTWEELQDRFMPATQEEEAQIPKKMPHIVIIVDELADLMMTSAKEVESYIVRIAQKSRAVGIHIILATQRPQATVVTGLIKSNLPCRIGFKVASRMDSRIILDANGAETLLGHGDMLFLKPGTSDIVRAQGAYLDDLEIKHVVKHLRTVAEPQYHPELMQMNRIDTSLIKRDDLFDEAVEIVLETRRGSVSLLQRRLSIGYARASRIIEMMAASGILGEYKGSQAREVVMTADEWERVKGSLASGGSPVEEEDFESSHDYSEFDAEGVGVDESQLDDDGQEYEIVEEEIVVGEEEFEDDEAEEEDDEEYLTPGEYIEED